MREKECLVYCLRCNLVIGGMKLGWGFGTCGKGVTDFVVSDRMGRIFGKVRVR